jgi:hypothetical protein
MIAAGPYHVLALIPVYNDWEAVKLLLGQLDQVMREEFFSLEVLLLDDASATPCPEELRFLKLTAITGVSVLSLRRNLGHQRAIAIGLAHVEANLECDAVLIMDGDGEDDPRDVPRLVARLREIDGSRIVFAERSKRSEGLVFRCGYALYRLLHRAMTGTNVRMGNFSVVPAALLRRLVVLSELWNHYAAAVLRARVPHERIPTVRAQRLGGQSKMNFVSLVVHGLSALSVFSEIIGVRLLLFCGVLTTVLGFVLAGVVGIKLFTSLAIPGWASTVGGLALILLMQTLGLGVVFVFVVLQGRGNTTFLPARDHAYFIDRQIRLFPLEQTALEPRGGIYEHR